MSLSVFDWASFMSFVAIMILSTLMLLLQGHVVCQNFTLTGPHG